MVAKGLWRHMLGKAVVPTLFMLLNGVLVLPDGKTEANEDQIESKEAKIAKYKRKEYLAQHVLLSTMSTHLGNKIKDMDSSKEMWDMIESDTTTKSTLYLIDAEDQLTSMKLVDNTDPKAHLAEIKSHFNTMLWRHNNLIKMGSNLSDTQLNTLIMTSLPDSY